MTEREDKLDLALRESCQRVQQLPEIPQQSSADPDDEVLLRLLDGGLPSAQTLAVRAQVEASPYARERLVTLSEALAEAETAAAAPIPINRFDETVIADSPSPVRLSFMWARGCLRYLWGTLEPRSLVAVPVPTRSGVFKRHEEETTFFDFAHRIDGIEVVIQIERVRDDLLDVQLSFSGDDDRLDRLRVTLADRRGSLLDSQPVEGGKTRFAALEPLPHELLITSAQKELGRVRLDVHAG
jgi:hypothetical protein